MGTPLRVLIVEDSEDDALLCLRELRAAYEPITHRRVDTAEAMSAALDQQTWDVVIADYSMPRFTGLAALRLLRGRNPDLPFILVSGVVGEEDAVVAMKAGAHDYITKGRLSRLVPAVERELREVQVRRERQQAEQALRESEDRYRLLAEHSRDLIGLVDLHGHFLYASPSYLTVLGVPPAELRRRSVFTLMHPSDTQRVQNALRQLISSAASQTVEVRLGTGGGDWIELEAIFSAVSDREGAVERVLVSARDITERKRAEAEIRALNRELEQRVEERTAQLQEAVHDLQRQIAERRRAEAERAGLTAVIEREQATLAAVMASMSDGVLVLDRDYRIRYCNARAAHYFGLNPAQIVGQPVESVVSQVVDFTVEPAATRVRWQALLRKPDISSGTEISITKPERRDLRVSAFSVTDTEGLSLGILVQDITAAKALALLEERERIAMDLHDGVIQSLYAVVLRLGVHERALGQGATSTREVLRQTRAEIHDVIQEIRNDIFRLRGQPSGLRAGLEAVAQEVRKVVAVRTEIQADVDHLISHVMTDTILRVVREATSNVIRHADASEMTIGLTKVDDKLVLMVRDNGRGFNPEAPGPQPGNPSCGQGLSNMAGRAAMLGGQLTVVSALGRGTEIRLEVPV